MLTVIILSIQGQCLDGINILQFNMVTIFVSIPDLKSLRLLIWIYEGGIDCVAELTIVPLEPNETVDMSDKPQRNVWQFTDGKQECWFPEAEPVTEEIRKHVVAVIPLLKSGNSPSRKRTGKMKKWALETCSDTMLMTRKIQLAASIDAVGAAFKNWDLL